MRGVHKETGGFPATISYPLPGAAGEGLSAYRAMERLGKVVNVTETSSLVEQLIRADMTAEAGEVTRAMLARDTHPLPKIFR